MKRNRPAQPVRLRNAHGSYGHLMQFMEHVVESGFLRRGRLDALVVASAPESLLKKLGW